MPLISEVVKWRGRVSLISEVLHCATLHMHHASMHHALCNMPLAPCPMHHAPLSLHHAILHVHHVFQQCNCHIAPTLLRGEWGHSAQSVVQGHIVHGAWAWIIGHHYTSPACCLSADSVRMGHIVKLM